MEELTVPMELRWRNCCSVGSEGDLSFKNFMTGYSRAISGRAQAYLADGTKELGGVHVGADGIRCAVRKHFPLNLTILGNEGRVLFGKMGTMP